MPDMGAISMTHWANLLTLARLIATVPCAWAIVEGHWTWAAALFVFAVATDLADGPIARRYDAATPLGGLLDHGTDAVFVTVMLSVLSGQGYTPWLLPVLVAAAFTQYALDSNALRGRRLRASWLGRCNGIAYFVVVGTPVIRNALALHWPSDALISVIAWALVGTTIMSMAYRLLALKRARAQMR